MRIDGIERDTMPNFGSLGEALEELEREMNETVGSVNSTSEPVDIRLRTSSRWKNHALMTCRARVMVHDRMDQYEGGHPLMQMGHTRPIYVRELRDKQYAYCVLGEGSKCRATEMLRHPKTEDDNDKEY